MVSSRWLVSSQSHGIVIRPDFAGRTLTQMRDGLAATIETGVMSAHGNVVAMAWEALSDVYDPELCGHIARLVREQPHRGLPGGAGDRGAG